MGGDWKAGTGFDEPGTHMEWAGGAGGAARGYGPPWTERPPRRLGAGAILAMVLGGVLLFVAGGLVGVAVVWFAFAPAVFTVGADGDVGEFALEPGACGMGVLADGGSWGADDAVPCEEAHDFEVYASSVLPPETGEHYPDLDALVAYGDAFCWMMFEPFVRRDWWDSELDYEVVVPSSQAWAEGQRGVRCVLRAGEQLIGSARGSGW